MDVSVLMLQGGMFITQSLAGNNRLGGQDFNDRTLRFLKEVSYLRGELSFGISFDFYRVIIQNLFEHLSA